jgi:glutamyl-tRNA synthetase
VTVRARFAPSPTGYLHVGSARTALFNWLFCRSTGAEFVLRIEDTDLTRNQPEVVDNLLDILRWLGLDWDDGPLFQSGRAARHSEVVEQLLGTGRAYVDDGAVRLRVPDEGVTGWDDVVLDRVEFCNADIEDFVIRRSDGSPLFLLANLIDDLDMGITHVIRGADMVNNVPRQLLLLDALGVASPFTYAHLPLLVDQSRRKLSKRFGDVSVESYRARGFLPTAFANYLALLGWGPKDSVEIRPLGDIVELFRLEDVVKSPAFFDVAKLTAINADYVRALPVEEFVAQSRAVWFAQPERFVRDVQERTHVLSDVSTLVDWFYADPAAVVASWEKVMSGADAARILDTALATYGDISLAWEADELQRALTAAGEGLGLKLGKVQGPVRVAALGRQVGPPLFSALEVLGRDRTLERLAAARARLGA